MSFSKVSFRKVLFGGCVSVPRRPPAIDVIYESIAWGAPYRVFYTIFTTAVSAAMQADPVRNRGNSAVVVLP